MLKLEIAALGMLICIGGGCTSTRESPPAFGMQFSETGLRVIRSKAWPPGKFDADNQVHPKIVGSTGDPASASSALAITEFQMAQERARRQARLQQAIEDRRHAQRQSTGNPSAVYYGRLIEYQVFDGKKKSYPPAVSGTSPLKTTKQSPASKMPARLPAHPPPMTIYINQNKRRSQSIMDRQAP